MREREREREQMMPRVLQHNQVTRTYSNNNTNTTITIQGVAEVVDIGVYHPAFPFVIISCGLGANDQGQLMLTPSNVVC
jgi:hypothetical protein